MYFGDRLCAETQGVFIGPKISMLEYASASASAVEESTRGT